MKAGTKVALGCVVLLLGGLALSLVSDYLRTRIRGEVSLTHIPAAEAQNFTRPKVTTLNAKLNKLVTCTQDRKATYEVEKNKRSNHYTLKLVFPFVFQNNSPYYVKFTMHCRIVRGPSRYAEDVAAADSYTASPKDARRFGRVTITYPGAYKDKEPKEYLYDCGCEAEVVEKPLGILRVPFTPYE